MESQLYNYMFFVTLKNGEKEVISIDSESLDKAVSIVMLNTDFFTIKYMRTFHEPPHIFIPAN